MALIDTYKRNVESIRSDITKLQKEKNKESKNATDALKKINMAKQAASKTKNESTIKNKLREVERFSKKYSDAQNNLTKIEDKITDKQKKLNLALDKVEKEEKRINAQKDKEEARKEKEREQQYRKLSQNVSNQELRQKEMLKDIEKLKYVPQKITVLFLAINPKDTCQLRLDEEARNIRETITKSKHRDSVDFETRWAVRPMDLLQAINEVKPTIIHFSGHGAKSGELALEDNKGNAKLIEPEAITQAITTISDTVKFAFFDACNSAPQAELVVKYIDGAIGMKSEIGDEAAIAFSSQFYSSIGFGNSVFQAFQQAKAILMMEHPDEVDTPVLCIGNKIDADELIIVDPEANA